MLSIYYVEELRLQAKITKFAHMKLLKGLIIIVFFSASFYSKHLVHSKIKTIFFEPAHFTNVGVKKVHLKSCFTFRSGSESSMPYKHKKRNRKGVKPVFTCLNAENNFKINNFSSQNNFIRTDFYLTLKITANCKRGPPAELLFV